MNHKPRNIHPPSRMYSWTWNAECRSCNDDWIPCGEIHTIVGRIRFIYAKVSAQPLEWKYGLVTQSEGWEEDGTRGYSMQHHHHPHQTFCFLHTYILNLIFWSISYIYAVGMGHPSWWISCSQVFLADMLNGGIPNGVKEDQNKNCSSKKTR